jgi:hypothetical protein
MVYFSDYLAQAILASLTELKPPLSTGDSALAFVSQKTFQLSGDLNVTGVAIAICLTLLRY